MLNSKTLTDVAKRIKIKMPAITSVSEYCFGGARQ